MHMALGSIEPYRGSARIEVPAAIDGKPARIVAIPARDPSVAGVDVLLVTREGSCDLARVGTCESSELHVEACFGLNALDGPCVSASLVPTRNRLRIDGTVVDRDGRRRDVGMTGYSELCIADDTHVTAAAVGPDVMGFVETLQSALLACDPISYGFLADCPVRTIEADGGTYLAFDGKAIDVTDSTLGKVAASVIGLIGPSIPLRNARQVMTDRESSLECTPPRGMEPPCSTRTRNSS